jgi:tetratricopeptide (TPR) repeat protein
MLRGQPREALKEMDAGVPPFRDLGVAIVYHALGRRTESDAALARAKGARGDVNSTNIAVAHAYRGEFDQAFEWLDKAIAARDITLAHEPLLASLRADSRYSALLRKMKLPESAAPTFAAVIGDPESRRVRSRARARTCCWNSPLPPRGRARSARTS